MNNNNNNNINREELERENKKKRYIAMTIAFLLGIGVGGVSSSESCNISEHEKSIKKLESLEKDYSSLEASSKTELESLKSDYETKISELNNKLEEAEPYFAMKKEEQLQLEAETKKKEEQRLKEEKEKEEKEKQAKIDSMTKTLSNGNYISGEDFEEGRYDIVAIKGGGNVTSDNIFSGGINAIMGVADDGFYHKEYKNINLPAGTQLTIDGVTIKLIPKNI